MNYNGLYALIGLNEQSEEYIIRIDSKPHLPDDGFPMWRPIVDSPPAYDPATQNRAQNPQAEWTIGAESVAVTYTVTDKTAQEILDYQRAQNTLETLEVTQWTVPADGTSYVIAKYYSQDTVYFVVNGDVITVTPDEVWTAELEIAADAPGPIDISVKNHKAVVVATEVV
jgi:hypothetical protein